MGFFKKYRETMLALTGPETAETLTGMQQFFQGGRNWTRGVYHREDDGSRCLVGAMQALRASPVEQARYWLQKAIAERGEWEGSIESFNDNHSFAEVAQVIERAKQLAMAGHGVARPALTYQPGEDAPRVTVIRRADMERVNRRVERAQRRAKD